MKSSADIKDWTRRYENALRAYLGQGGKPDVKPAVTLGRQAAVLGLETLDVANVHEQVLSSLAVSNVNATACAQRFFTEALVPIERTHVAARNAEFRVQELTRTLQQRKRETATSKRKLKQGIVRRQSAEAASRNLKLERAQLLKESQKLQHRLRYRLRKLMGMQEEGQRKHSRNLRNEIAQTLLALDIRLLALKEAGLASLKNLSKEIAETEGLVRQSGKTLKRLAHDSKKQK